MGSFAVECSELADGGSGLNVSRSHLCMTAHIIVLAQTRRSFLPGGREKPFLALPENEQMCES